MKKYLMKTIVTALLVAFMIAPTGCVGREDTDEGIDPNKKQIYVGVYDTGSSDLQWIYKAKAKFEEKYSDYQAIIKPQDVDIKWDKLQLGIKSTYIDLYVTSSIDYYTLVGDQDVADITDYVVEPLTEWGETKSIENKMNGDVDLQNYYKVNGKYYGVPHMDSIVNMIYDVDLFEEKGFFFDEEGEFTNGKDSDKSVGADGEAGTLDDGLPVTYEDFKKLCDYIAEKGCKPLTFPGAYPEYNEHMLDAFWAAYEGKADFETNYKLVGNDDKLGEINFDNAYELQKQQGKKAALTYAYDITKNSDEWLTKDPFNDANNTTTHQNFLQSKYQSPRIAMMFEGSWWEEESRGIFKWLAEDKGDSMKMENRRFGVMPIPRFIGTDGVEDQTNQKRTLFTPASTAVIIPKKSKHIDMAGKFLRLLYTDEAMVEYTENTGMKKSVSYEISANRLSKMSYYKQSVWNIMSDKNTEIARELPQSSLRRNNQSAFKLWSWEYNDVADNTILKFNGSTFGDYTKEQAIKTYFDGMYNYWKTQWKNIKK